MTLLLLEALGALIILVLIVWWTMFSGRPGGEPPRDDGPRDDSRESARTDASGSGAEKKQ